MTEALLRRRLWRVWSDFRERRHDRVRPRISQTSQAVGSIGGWGERWDLNPRRSVPQTDALPAELRSPQIDCQQFITVFLALFLFALEGLRFTPPLRPCSRSRSRSPCVPGRGLDDALQWLSSSSGSDPGLPPSRHSAYRRSPEKARPKSRIPNPFRSYTVRKTSYAGENVPFRHLK